MPQGLILYKIFVIMITLKFKYDTNDKSIIRQYMIEYSSCLHYLYKRIYDSVKFAMKK